jgi:hypothetical protein
MAKSHCTNQEIGAAKTLRRWLLVTSCIFSTFAGPAQASSEDAVPPPEARVMTGVELYMLYHDKSWQWRDGVGWMRSDRRRFTAWAGSGQNFTWAEGRWIVTDGGRLCLDAQWHSSSGVYPDKTCFSHKRHHDTIYQKREPSEAWYVFKHPGFAKGDEFSKLVSKDLVSVRIRTAIEPATPLPYAKINRRIQQ